MTDRSWRAAVRRAATILVSGLLVFALTACSADGARREDGGGATSEPTRVILASTTSTQDSGLLDVLVAAFEAAHPEYRVDVVAVGTGEALQMGRNGDADVLLVHAKDDEQRFVADGYGTERRDVCYNDFVIVGPPADPASVRDARDASAAMRAIAAAGGWRPDGRHGGAPVMPGAAFVSRGDDSGTHKKELALWEAAGVAPGGDWYLSTGQGMGETLKVASEKQAYTLADRATFLAMRSALDLEVLYEGASDLRNQYGVIPVTGARNAAGARAFAEWVTSAEGQKVIGSFGVEKFGQALFTPSAR